MIPRQQVNSGRRPHRLLRALAVLALALLPSCTMHSLAYEWHERVGADGKPVYYVNTTNVGFNLFIFVPLVGHTTVHEMIDDLTENIAQKGGDKIRIVDGGTSNYWYGVPPLTWFFTPVLCEVSAEYQPSPAELAKLRDKTEAGQKSAQPGR